MGDVLVKLDPVDEERNVKQAKVNVLVAENNLATARLNLRIAEEKLAHDEDTAKANLQSAKNDAQNKKTEHERQIQLFEKKFSSQEALDNAQLAAAQAEIAVKNREIAIEELATQRVELELKRNAIADAEANLETRKLTLSDAEQRLSDTTVTAPLDGVIAALNVQIGQIVSSGTNSVNAGTDIMTISDVNTMFTDVDVDESEISNIDVGLPVDIVTESTDERKFHGIVRRIFTRGSRNRGVVIFKVHIEITDPDLKYLRAETTTNIEIILAESKDTLSVPLPALTINGDKKSVVVQTGEGENITTEKRDVEVGISNGNDVEIVSGLNDGDQVVISVSPDESRWIRRALDKKVMTEWQTGRGARAVRSR
jgi:HlyD family secretion protein